MRGSAISAHSASFSPACARAAPFHSAGERAASPISCHPSLAARPTDLLRLSFLFFFFFFFCLCPRRCHRASQNKKKSSKRKKEKQAVDRTAAERGEGSAVRCLLNAHRSAASFDKSLTTLLPRCLQPHSFASLRVRGDESIRHWSSGSGSSCIGSRLVSSTAICLASS